MVGHAGGLNREDDAIPFGHEEEGVIDAGGMFPVRAEKRHDCLLLANDINDADGRFHRSGRSENTMMTEMVQMMQPKGMSQSRLKEAPRACSTAATEIPAAHARQIQPVTWTRILAR